MLPQLASQVKQKLDAAFGGMYYSGDALMLAGNAETEPEPDFPCRNEQAIRGTAENLVARLTASVQLRKTSKQTPVLSCRMWQLNSVCMQCSPVSGASLPNYTHDSTHCR